MIVPAIVPYATPTALCKWHYPSPLYILPCVCTITYLPLQGPYSDLVGVLPATMPCTMPVPLPHLLPAPPAIHTQPHTPRFRSRCQFPAAVLLPPDYACLPVDVDLTFLRSGFIRFVAGLCFVQGATLPHTWNSYTRFVAEQPGCCHLPCHATAAFFTTRKYARFHHYHRFCTFLTLHDGSFWLRFY